MELNASVVDGELCLVQDQEAGTMCRNPLGGSFLMLEVVERLGYVGCTERKLMNVRDIWVMLVAEEMRVILVVEEI